MSVEKNAEYYATLDGFYRQEVEDKNEGATFMGDYTRYAGIELEFFGVEMVLLFIVQIIIYNSLMTKVNGRALRMIQWVHSMDFEILGNSVKSGFMVSYLTVIGYVYLITPFLSLIVWIAIMMVDA